ncbi:DODA-type extradiol aromatic ring-opening family dioxygenase [Calditerricola satsumensis]|uniref:Dioxygenase n=1 Tax=Calditerricola satsumensis TaxID=373054 RepID=A0A8J3BBI1_9BACI|nr:class III extradiol ring-cleavage dioxygenase [Calditerricola satsumensis]GGJ99007.1 dioxygenase [Calditerricola satsumensis]
MALPTLFVAHGAPTLAVEDSAYARFLRRLGEELERPRALVVLTAHWLHPTQQVSGAAQHRLLYDFFGFPEELYRLTYPAKGDPELARAIANRLAQEGIPCSLDAERGLDHGVWVPLSLLYPRADIPVVALSVNPSLPPEVQYRIGRALAFLRAEGVLVIGSGGTVHNLRALDWAAAEAEAWAVQFDDWLAGTLSAWDLPSLFRYKELAPHAERAVPTMEHFVPLLVAMGAADDARRAVRLYQTYTYGSLSLNCWRFG